MCVCGGGVRTTFWMWSEIKWIQTLEEETNWTAIRKLNVCSTWTNWSRSGLYWQLHDRALQTPTAGLCLCEATQNYHKAAITACHQGWRMDVTRQRNVQMKEKTAKKLEKSFIDEQIWLLGVYTHTVTLVQSVVVACSHHGCLSLNRSLNPSCEPWEVPAWFHFIQHASQTWQTFRIQPSWFYRLDFSDWLTLQLTFDVNPAFYWKILHTWSTLFFVLTITWQEQQLLQRYKRKERDRKTIINLLVKHSRIMDWKADAVKMVVLLSGSI